MYIGRLFLGLHCRYNSAAAASVVAFAAVAITVRIGGTNAGKMMGGKGGEWGVLCEFEYCSMEHIVGRILLQLL